MNENGLQNDKPVDQLIPVFIVSPREGRQSIASVFEDAKSIDSGQ